MKDDFKDVLKMLAKALPAEMDAECVELDNGSAWLGFSPQKGHPKQFIMSDGDALSNAAGTTVLLQFIEEQGYGFKIERYYMEEERVWMWSIDLYEVISGHILAFVNFNTEAKAVSKAALEVAERGKK